VSDTTHNDVLHDEGFHEIQLSGKQLVAIFMATTVIAVVIFLCGVQVGRNVKGDRLASSEPSDTVASAATAPPPASTPTEAAPSSGPPAAEPPAPAQEPDDELSYAKRLQSADPSANDKIAAKPQPVAPPASTPAPMVATKQAPAAKPSAPAAAPAASGRPGAWIVQLSANKDRGQAVSLARDLSAKGYPAFVLDPAPGAPAIFRVQVGGYPDADKANQAARKLEKEEHFKPYVRSR
jgi:hypothetical protein